MTLKPWVIFLITFLNFTKLASSNKVEKRSLIDGVPIIHFKGTLLNDLDDPVQNALIQFWQTDPVGRYDHPGAGAVTLNPNFQYYGTAKTSEDGGFWFKTHRPGIYSGRPTHIHFKVWVGGVAILTSQLYFLDENTSYPSTLQLELKEEIDEDGLTYFSTSKTIRVNLNLGGSGPFTPRDMEGPFYPAVEFFDFDSDLTNTQNSNEGTPIPTVSPSASLSLEPSSAAPVTNNEGSIHPTLDTFDDVLPTSSPSDTLTTPTPSAPNDEPMPSDDSSAASGKMQTFGLLLVFSTFFLDIIIHF